MTHFKDLPEGRTNYCPTCEKNAHIEMELHSAKKEIERLNKWGAKDDLALEAKIKFLNSRTEKIINKMRNELIRLIDLVGEQDIKLINDVLDEVEITNA